MSYTVATYIIWFNKQNKTHKVIDFGKTIEITSPFSRWMIKHDQIRLHHFSKALKDYHIGIMFKKIKMIKISMGILWVIREKVTVCIKIAFII